MEEFWWRSSRKGRARRLEIPVTARKISRILFDNEVTPILYEMCFLDLIRVFERIVFEFVDNATGEIEKIINKSKEIYAFSSCAAKFVKSSTNRDSKQPGTHPGNLGRKTLFGL